MPTLQGNALIGQSGGPTCVINQSLVGLVEGCLARAEIHNVYGAWRGIGGVLEEDFIDLGRQSREVLEAVAATPCAALRSIRKKPTRDDCARALEVFAAHDIRYFFYIGGNDSAETAHLLNEVALERGYEVRLFHVPKTIDNDLLVTDHCPGYGSAARFVAQALMGDNEDNRSLAGVKIDVVMGRHAGWLTAAASLGRRSEEDGPHLVYVPERSFALDDFLGHVEGVLERFGRCLVAVSEGIHDAGGTLVAETAAAEKDSFGNVQLSGSGALGDILARHVKRGLGGKLRVRADTFGYLQRSYFGVVSEVDAAEARQAGRQAVALAVAGQAPHGTIVLRRRPGTEYAVDYEVAALSDVAGGTKTLPDAHIEGTHGIAAAFRAYALPLVGPLPTPGRLVPAPVEKRWRSG